MKILLTILLLVINFTFLKSQNILSGKIISKDKIIVLHSYYFNNLSVVDTINIDKYGTFNYDLTKLIYGEYNLKNSDVDIDFLYKNESIDLFYDYSKPKSLKINNSIENNTLNNFFEFYSINNTSYTLLSQLLKFYPKEDSFYLDIEKRRNILNTRNTAFIDSINQNSTLIGEVSKLYFNSNSSFLKTDIIYDTLLIRTRFIGDLIISHINTYENRKLNREQQQKAFFTAVDTILFAFKQNKNLMLLVSEFLIKKFRYYDLEIIMEYTAKTAIKYSENFKPKDNVISDILLLIKSINSTTVGNKALNFSLNNKTLYELKAKQKLLIFWSSECPHCEIYIEQIMENISDLSPKTQVITYSLDYKNEAWANAIKKFNSEWINICDCNNKNNISDKYAIYATPTMILLNENNEIIAKPREIDQLFKIFENE